MTSKTAERTGSKRGDAAAPANYLVYWRPQTVEQCCVGETLDYAGSNQFVKVHSDETLWIVTSRDGILFLVGRLIIREEPMATGRARKQFDHRLWDATHHVRARPGTAAPMQQLRLDGVAPDLTFVSATAPRLKIRRGRINPQSLQTMRRLTPESVALLSRIWFQPGHTLSCG